MSDHEHNHDHDRNSNINLSALVAGALIGAAAIYLFGTEKGRKLKDELLEEGQKLLDKIGDEVDKAQDQLEEHQEEIKGKLAEDIEEVEDPGQRRRIEDTTQDVVENIAEVPQHTEGHEETRMTEGSEEPRGIVSVQKKGRKFFFHRSHPSAES